MRVVSLDSRTHTQCEQRLCLLVCQVGTSAASFERTYGQPASVKVTAEDDLPMYLNRSLSHVQLCQSFDSRPCLVVWQVGTSAAPLRKALMDSGLGEALVGGGLQGDLRQPVFSIGLKGADPANFHQACSSGCHHFGASVAAMHLPAAILPGLDSRGVGFLF